AIEGPAKEWVEHLLPLVTERGVGTFLLSSSDPETIRHFITHVAPALRAAADQAIPGLSAARPVRSAAVLAKRVPTVDYEAVPASLTAIEPGDYRYARARSTYLRGGSPAIVLRPTSAEQVADAIAFARMHP